MKTMEKIEKVLSLMNSDDQEYCILNQFPYIFTKAELYLKIGPDNYRKEDFFQQPPLNVAIKDMESIRYGCEQIVEGRGFNLSTPLQGLGVSGFYRLMELFHFQFESRKTKYSFIYEEEKGALDIMTFTHQMDDRKATLFHFCPMKPKRGV
ncbi:hypothetical protein LBMAG26_11310 [Bacteroidota bacterium]|nr:hypothetical protein LBMAG26_11310 [Bacteroidota bacterium]